MKPSKIFQTVLVISFTLMLASCSSTRVEIPDGEWCGFMGKYGAACDRTFTSAPRKMTEEEAKAWSFGKIATDSANFAGWKKAILKLCEYSKICTREFKAAVHAAFGRVDGINQTRQQECLKGGCPRAATIKTPAKQFTLP